VKGRFGTVLVRVGAITPGSVPSFEQVAPDLRRDLARQDAIAKVADLHNKMEDERGGGANVVDAAKKLGLTAVTIDAVDRSGRGPDGNPVAGIPQGTNIIAQAFAADVGVDTETITYNGGYIWFDVLGITQARERPLDEVKPQVEAKWRENEVTSRLRTKAAEMAKAIEGGAKLEDQAAAMGLKVETTPPFKRDGDVAGLPNIVNEVAFRTAKDGVGQTQGGGGTDWYVFRVLSVTLPPVDQASADVKKLKETLDRALSEEQITQYISAVERRIGVSVNQSAVAQVTGAGS
jgi:peptidyl-prolyl cis-trans isomerase D